MPSIDSSTGGSSLVHLRGRCAALFALAIVVYGVFCSFMGYAVSPDVGVPTEEAALMHELEGRVVSLREGLSADQAYGYVTVDPARPAAAQAYRYTMTRYLLAPVAVFNDPEYPVLIVDMPDDAALDGYVDEQGLTVIYRPDPAVAGVAVVARGEP